MKDFLLVVYQASDHALGLVDYREYSQGRNDHVDVIIIFNEINDETVEFVYILVDELHGIGIWRDFVFYFIDCAGSLLLSAGFSELTDEVSTEKAESKIIYPGEVHLMDFAESFCICWINVHALSIWDLDSDLSEDPLLTDR